MNRPPETGADRTGVRPGRMVSSEMFRMSPWLKGEVPSIYNLGVRDDRYPRRSMTGPVRAGDAMVDRPDRPRWRRSWGSRRAAGGGRAAQVALRWRRETAPRPILVA